MQLIIVFPISLFHLPYVHKHVYVYMCMYLLPRNICDFSNSFLAFNSSSIYFRAYCSTARGWFLYLCMSFFIYRFVFQLFFALFSFLFVRFLVTFLTISWCVHYRNLIVRSHDKISFFIFTAFVRTNSKVNKLRLFNGIMAFAYFKHCDFFK